mgnify:CR=1 FL=1
MKTKTDILLLLGLGLLALVCALGFFHLDLDRENRSMKSRDTAQAAAEVLREKEFGAENPLVFMLEPIRKGLLDPAKDPAVGPWIQSIRRLPAVTQVRILPQSGPDALFLVVLIDSDAGGDFFDRVQSTLDGARAMHPAAYHFHATGQALGEIAIAHAMDQERGRIVPILLVTLLLLLWLAYRSFVLASGILASALLGILVLGGIQWVFGFAVDPISSLIPPVLLTVGVAGSVHLVEAFLGLRAEGVDTEQATHRSFQDLWKPALLTVSTTIAGFLGLLWSPIPAVGRFGLLAALGVALTCVLTFLFLPAWLRVFARGEGMERLRRDRGVWSHLSSGMAIVLGHRARVVAFAGAGLVLFFIWEWAGISVDTHPIRILPTHDAFRVDTEHVANAVGGIETFDLLLPGPTPAKGTRKVNLLRRTIDHEPLVAGLIGIVERSPSGLRRQRVLLRPSGTKERAAMFGRIEHRAHALGWPDAVTAGAPVIVAKDSNQLVRSQLMGMVFTLFFLWVAMSFGFKSPALGLLGLVPNIVPAILLYGGLALSNRPLSVGSAMIGSVLLGLTVDDTIHFLYRYKKSRVFGSSRIVSIARSFRIAGRALAITTLVQATGFLVCIFGALDSSREFAVLASATMVLALAADLLLLPSIMLFRRARPVLP